MINSEATRHVLIVGGGTSGWITAAYLGKHLSCKEPGAVQVTLIESEDIGTIGVGEGTFPTMRVTLETLGISETEFIRETSATFKQAAKFAHWLYNPADNHPRNYYYHPFDVPLGGPHMDIAKYWLQEKEKYGPYFDEAVSIQGTTCENNLAPKKITHKEFAGLNYAYHLDAAAFARLLRKKSVEEFGVKHLTGTVTDVKKAADGSIASVISKEHGELHADLFVDCTGFSARLIGQEYNTAFKSIDDVLLVDHAITVQVPYASPDAPIPTHTISTAQEAGWTWDIGLQHRRGVGYVYSARHTSHERAEDVLQAYLGDSVDLSGARRVPMKTGYRTEQWHKNCVAIGLSAGFCEPLEATAIAMIELAARFLVSEFPYSKASYPIAAKAFNTSFVYRWDAIVDFVKMHYYLSRRNDHPFWLDNTSPETATDSLLEKLEKWRYSTPNRNDFPNVNEMFGVESNQFVLYGMDYQSHIQPSALINEQHYADKLHKQLCMQKEKISQMLPAHNALIDQVLKHGFAKL